MKRSHWITTALILLVFRTAAHAEDGTDWMGAYLNENKVGWSRFEISFLDQAPPNLPKDWTTRFSRDPAGTYFLCSQSSMEVQAYGASNRISWEMNATLDQDLSLLDFQFEMKGVDSHIVLHGESRPNELLMAIESAGTESRESLPIDHGRIFVAESIPILIAKKLEKGESIDGEIPVFEPHQLSCSVWELVFDGTETLSTIGGPVETYRINQDIGGLTSTLWIDSSGRVYKEWAPLAEGLGYVSFFETEDQARDRAFFHPEISSKNGSPNPSPYESPDLLHATSVRVEEEIRHSNRVHRMVIDLWDFDLRHPIPEGKWQSNLGRYKDTTPTERLPLRLEIVSPDPTSETLREHGDLSEEVAKEFETYLKDESLVQSTHPKIVELGKELTAGLDSPWEKALALYDWMEANIQTAFRITLPSAVEVLESKKGDCNEQSTLFAALARASGVPAKICTGLVYQGDGFYYHAWNEVLVSADPEVWIPIDTALKQTRVDATHIKFGEGGLKNQTYLNQLIGRVRARIVELESDDPDSEPHQAFRNQDSG